MFLSPIPGHPYFIPFKMFSEAHKIIRYCKLSIPLRTQEKGKKYKIRKRECWREVSDIKISSISGTIPDSSFSSFSLNIEITIFLSYSFLFFPHLNFPNFPPPSFLSLSLHQLFTIVLY